MKKLFSVISLGIIFLSSCEMEMVGERRQYHPRGWEHRHHPEHHERYNHGYHHDERGNEIIIQPRR